MSQANHKRVRVITAYQAQYPDPIRVKAGEQIRVGREDPEFPGWKWCTASDGCSGWVPIELLSGSAPDASIIQDYSAQELSVVVGEELNIEDARHSWLLVRNATGEHGWIPASHVTTLDQH